MADQPELPSTRRALESDAARSGEPASTPESKRAKRPEGAGEGEEPEQCEVRRKLSKLRNVLQVRGD